MHGNLTLVIRTMEDPLATDLKTREVDPQVKQALASAEVTESAGAYFLNIKERLSPALYAEADKVLKRLGGKWVRGKGTRFEVDPRPAIGSILADGRYVDPKSHGYFPTPDHVVERLVELADVRHGHFCLEPSAGRGAIASLLVAIVGWQNLVCFELLPENRKELVRQGYELHDTPDFLAATPRPQFDRIVMNPPFAHLADVDHVRQAFEFLKPGGRLVAITSPSWTFQSQRKAVEFKAFVSRYNAWPKIDGRPPAPEGVPFDSLPEGTFGDAGTEIRTLIVVLDKPA